MAVRYNYGMILKLLIIADVVMLLFLGLAWQLLPEEIPLYYLSSWGKDQIAPLWQIIFIPIIMHIFYGINNFITKKFLKNEDLLIHILNYSTVFLIIGLTGVFLKILILVT